VVRERASALKLISVAPHEAVLALCRRRDLGDPNSDLECRALPIGGVALPGVVNFDSPLIWALTQQRGASKQRKNG
jgi:hypothetical protein